MEYFLEIKFLLRGLKTLQTKQYGPEMKMEKRNHRHLNSDSSGQCTPHSWPLPKALCLCFDCF